MTFPLEIVHEDADVVALNKPSGQLVIPGRGRSPGLPLNHAASEHLGRKVLVVHRIDRDASGIVVFALNASAHRRLCGLFSGRKVVKRYLALVAGICARPGVVSKPIRRFGSGRMGTGAGGKRSVTRFRPLESPGNDTLLEVIPETGRRHQIRVHLYSRGHPIIGDTLYGEERPVGGAPRLMLHAEHLHIPRDDGTALDLAAPVPDDFRRVLEIRRQHA